MKSIPITSRWHVNGILIVILLSSAMLARQTELRCAVPELVAGTAIMTVTLAYGLYRFEQKQPLLSPLLIMAAALLLRLLFVFSPPQLSDDIYRYFWDGSTTLAGINPYAHAPEVQTPSTEMKTVHAQINHPGYVTIYPPAAQVLFAGGAGQGTVTGLKAFLVMLDLGLCALVIVLLKQLEMPTWRGILYAWNPLPILEIGSSGHVDGAGLTLLMGAFCLLMRGKNNQFRDTRDRWPYLISGALLATAGLVKLFPFLLLPLLLLLVPRGRRSLFMAGFFIMLALLILPFMPEASNMLVSFDAYARNWEFAGFAFNALRVITGSGLIARLTVSASFLTIAVALMLRFAASSTGDPSEKARTRHALKTCYAISMALLLLTPTLQPWYALCLAVFLPFCAGPSGLILCWAVFLTYQVQIPFFTSGKWIENPYVTAAVFGAPITAYLVGRAFQSVGKAA